MIGIGQAIIDVVNLPGQSGEPGFTDPFAFRFGANPAAEFFAGPDNEFDLTDAVTVSLWFTVDASLWGATNAQTRFMVDKASGSSLTTGYTVYFQNFSSQGVRSPYICATTGVSGFTITQRRLRVNIPAADTAYHFAYTYNKNNGEYRAYFNGQPVVNGSGSGSLINIGSITLGQSAPINTNNVNFVLGKTTDSSSTTGEFEGKMDEISIWNTDLSAQSIADIYNFSANGDLNQNPNVNNLVAWYRCGENATWTGSEWQMPNSKTGASAATNVVSTGLVEADKVAGII